MNSSLSAWVGVKPTVGWRRTSTPTTYYVVKFLRPDNLDKWGPEVHLDLSGSLKKVALPVVGWVPRGEGLPGVEALEVARREIELAFGVDTTNLTLEHEAPLLEEGRRGHTYRWVREDPAGFKWHYLADVFDRPTRLERRVVLPEEYQPRRPSRHGLAVLVAWWVFSLALFLARAVYSGLNARAYTVLGVAGFAAGTWSAMGALRAMDPGSVLLVWLLGVPLSGLLFALLAVVISPTVTYLARRPWPHVVATYARAVELKASAAATGLVVARGFGCGLLLLGAYSVLLRASLSAGLSWPDLHGLEGQIMNSFAPPLTALGFVLIGAAALAFLVGFSLSVARRWTSSPLLLCLLGGAVSLAAEHTSLPLKWINLALLFALYVAFSWILVRLDLLTLLASAFTYYLWRTTYPLVRMFETAGSMQFVLLLVLWGVLFAWALFAGFRPAWERAGRRLKEAIE